MPYRFLLLTFALVLAVTSAGASMAAQAGAASGPSSALGLNISRDTEPVNATCVLVQRQQRGSDVVLYFVTAAHLFKNANGELLPQARKIEVVVPLSPGSVAGAEQTTIVVDPKDVELPRGTMAGIAILRAVVARAELSPAALNWIERQVPDLPSRVASTAQFAVSPRQFEGPTILAACGEEKTGEIDVPFTLKAGETAVDASASLTNRKALRLADVKVLTLTNETVKLRFTLGGEPPPQPPAPCRSGQALVTVHVTVVKTPR